MRLQKEINIFAKEAMIKRFRAIETAVSVTKGNISAIISDSEIAELQNSETTMYSKLGKLDMSVSGLVQQYTDIATKYDSVRDQYTAIDSKLATYKTSVDGLSANITQVSTRLNNNYSTTETMNAAISAAKDEINLSVSKTYDNKIAKVFINTQNLSTFSVNIKLNKYTYTSFLMYGATSRNDGFMYIVFIDVVTEKRTVNFIKIADFVEDRTFSGTYSDDTSTLTINASGNIWGGIKMLMFKEANY